MRKNSRKIVLSRETLGCLELRSPAGGTWASCTCDSAVIEHCDPPITDPQYCFTVEPC